MRSLVSAIGKQLTQKWVHSEQCRYHQYTTIPAIAKRSRFAVAHGVLNIGWMNDGVQQQSYRIDKDMPLLAFDLLARIIAIGIDAGPPISALFTL